MGRSKSSSQNLAFLLWGSRESADHFCGLIAGLLSRALLACSVSAVHCGFVAVTSISKFSISFSAWRVTENNSGTGIWLLEQLLFGSAWGWWAQLPSHIAEESVCALSAFLSQPSQSHHWNDCSKETQNYLAFTSLSISISHSVLDPEEVAVGKAWQAFHSFARYFLFS